MPVVQVVIPIEEIEKRRAAVLVPNAIGKCPHCGSTLCPSPLEHQCDLTIHYGGGMDYGRCAL